MKTSVLILAAAVGLAMTAISAVSSHGAGYPRSSKLTIPEAKRLCQLWLATNAIMVLV